jgi:hypothetical protein
MTEIDNQLLEQFFQPARDYKVEDRGFTDQVMKLLPDRAMRLSQWWTAACLLLGVVLFVVFRGWESLIVGVLTLLNTNVGELHPIPFFMAMGGLCCIAVWELAHKLERC